MFSLGKIYVIQFNQKLNSILTILRLESVSSLKFILHSFIPDLIHNLNYILISLTLLVMWYKTYILGTLYYQYVVEFKNYEVAAAVFCSFIKYL